MRDDKDLVGSRENIQNEAEQDKSSILPCLNEELEAGLCQFVVDECATDRETQMLRCGKDVIKGTDLCPEHTVPTLDQISDACCKFAEAHLETDQDNETMVNITCMVMEEEKLIGDEDPDKASILEHVAINQAMAYLDLVRKIKDRQNKECWEDCELPIGACDHCDKR